MTGHRLAGGGAIDRDHPVTFTFNGRRLQGYAGDTLASALIANGVSLVARSFKYHRPRGIVGLGMQEPNALVQLGEGARTVPNVPATLVPLAERLVASSVNAWPSVDFDMGAVNDRLRRFLVAGFYYKTFIWPDWHLFEPLIRRAAGLGRAPDAPDPDLYAAQSAVCDVLVVGAGGAGLMAAKAAAIAGARVILAEADDRAGGSLGWTDERIDGREGREWAAAALDELAALGVRIMPRTAIVAYHDGNLLLGIEAQSGGARERLWKLRARRVVLATGAAERPLVFADNDRPGIMLADAILGYLRRYAVAPGRRALFFTNNDSAYAAAQAARDAGIDVAAIVDSRADAPAMRGVDGIPVIPGAVVTRAFGRRRVTGVEVVGPGGARRIDCDLVGLSGGWSPSVQLFSQSGGALRFDPDLACFRPDVSHQAESSCGAAAGVFDRAAGLVDGWRAGADSAAACGFTGGEAPRPIVAHGRDLVPDPLWQVPGVARKTAFVDFQTDVSLADLDLAVRENYRSVEHVKRYTTLGMGTDQGRLGNANAIGVLAELMAVSPGDVGTTRFRPPTLPSAFGPLAAGRGQGELYQPRRLLHAHDWHVGQGALFADYGWQRPDAYPRPGEDMEAASRREALAVRNAVGLFDASPIGKIALRGPDAGLFLDRVCVGTVSTLAPGRLRYGLMLDDHGTIIDDGVIARIATDEYLLHPSSGHADRIFRHLEDLRQCEWPDLDIVLQDQTGQGAVWALAGPAARRVLERAGTDIDLAPAAFPHMALRDGMVAGIAARIARVSFSGELGYEIAVPGGRSADLADALLAAGAGEGITPYGIEALEILRLEKGYIHVGGDTDSDSQPADIGMGGGVARKAVDFIGRRSLMRPASAAPDRKQLVGLTLPGSRDVLPGGAHIRSFGPDPSDGFVTSSLWSPTLERGVALALLRGGRARLGQTVTVWSEGRSWQALVTDPVAHDPSGERLRG